MASVGLVTKVGAPLGRRCDGYDGIRLIYLGTYKQTNRIHVSLKFHFNGICYLACVVETNVQSLAVGSI